MGNIPQNREIVDMDNSKVVGIVTQILLYNYGGVLQNFALQTVLKKIGYTPITLNHVLPKVGLLRYIRSCLKTCILYFTSKRRPFVNRRNSRPLPFDDFINKWIKTTKPFCQYSAELIEDYNIKQVIVGSDQVWRPSYSLNILDMYLVFCKQMNDVKRIAYAASFGVDEWEYSPEQTCECSALVKKFDAIGVREKTGVTLCKEYLDVDATLVLDPTLLLNKEDYCEVCKNTPIATGKILVAYVLDMNDSIRRLCESIAKERNMKLKIFSSGSQASLTIPEWLAMFRDASYVVTDSFHGTVFSIIFGKEFKCFYNKDRGATRFESLIDLYHSGKLEKMRESSLNWLKSALDN